MTKNQPINQWVRINKLLSVYRYSTLILAVAVVGFLGLTFFLVSRDSLVVGLTNQEKLFLAGSRRAVSISDADVEAISRTFLKTRYTWGADHGENIAKELSPIASDGLLQKVREFLAINKALLQQSSQDVIIREIKLENARVFALLDRVIALNSKMKVVSPLEVTLTLIRGSTNRFNPLGIYVNEIMEHEGE